MEGGEVLLMVQKSGDHQLIFMDICGKYPITGGAYMLGGAGFLLIVMSKFSCLDDQFSLLNDDLSGLQQGGGG